MRRASKLVQPLPEYTAILVSKLVMGEQVSTRTCPLKVDGKFHHRSPVMVLLPALRHAACPGPSVVAPTLEKLVGPMPIPGRPAQSSLAGGAVPAPPIARTVKAP